MTPTPPLLAQPARRARAPLAAGAELLAGALTRPSRAPLS